MSKIKVDSTKCPQDHPCPMMLQCPVGAITQQGFSAPEIDGEKCVLCKRCVVSCPYQAFSVE